MLAALDQEVLFLAHQRTLPVVIGVGDITSETGKICHYFFSDFENDLPNRMEIHLVRFRFMLEGSSDFRDRGDREDFYDGDSVRSSERRARDCS